ncbi:hypothetical protein RRG08_007396 [Elysia crispata]|uniref:Uncharacterized protein n=1 Tax=Elysia crispata TaxID=231223 RepID=A0AAE1DRX2_9GAST|nr:hypothetical protein RRG08_007396 [Elysia crispata]
MIIHRTISQTLSRALPSMTSLNVKTEETIRGIKLLPSFIPSLSHDLLDLISVNTHVTRDLVLGTCMSCWSCHGEGGEVVTCGGDSIVDQTEGGYGFPSSHAGGNTPEAQCTVGRLVLTLSDIKDLRTIQAGRFLYQLRRWSWNLSLPLVGD